ncbi:hypothetical protein FBQ97_04170 [Acidobacteria bacterium ACD]|nr:MAG: hypothetical protein EDX89_23500 [Acidobacteriota bacterium]MDL1948993.1 hypothetical protein [Acidobacteria bacterium ACD]
MRGRFTIGLDLGQAFDFTALVVLEEGEGRLYDLRHVERHRGEPYPVIVERTRDLVLRLPGPACLAVDATGVGRPVVDMLREGRVGEEVYGITLTGGEAAERKGDDFHVPKREVVAAVAGLLQTGRLRIPRRVPYASTLERELKRFRARITRSGHDTYEACRESDHDDLVLAVALASWLNERGRDGWLLLGRECLDRRRGGREERGRGTGR